MIYREARSSDLDRLLELEQNLIEIERQFNPSVQVCNASYWDVPTLIEDSDTHLVVVDECTEIIGVGYAQIRESEKYLVHEQHSYISFIYFHPEYRGYGLSQIMINHLVDWSRQRGMADCYLNVYQKNEAAIKAYTKAGFEPSLVEMKLSLPGDGCTTIK